MQVFPFVNVYTLNFDNVLVGHKVWFFSLSSSNFIFFKKLKMEQSFQNENRLSDNTCEIFINEIIMEKKSLLEQSKNHPSLQRKININPKRQK